MKKTFLALLLIGSGTALWAQDTQNQTNDNRYNNTNTKVNSSNYSAYNTVPNTVQMRFQRDNPTVMDAQWQPYNGFWRANYKVNGQDMVMFYSDRGESFMMALPVLQTQVPDEVVNTAKNKYGLNLYDITAVKGNNGQDIYKVRLTTDNGQFNGQASGQMNGQINNQLNNQMNGQMNGQTGGQLREEWIGTDGNVITEDQIWYKDTTAENMNNMTNTPNGVNNNTWNTNNTNAAGTNTTTNTGVDNTNNTNTGTNTTTTTTDMNTNTGTGNNMNTNQSTNNNNPDLNHQHGSDKNTKNQGAKTTGNKTKEQQ